MFLIHTIPTIAKKFIKYIFKFFFFFFLLVLYAKHLQKICIQSQFKSKYIELLKTVVDRIFIHLFWEM